MEIDEVVAIVIHELGHVHHYHLMKITCIVFVFTIFLLTIFSTVYREKSFLEPFGFSHQADFVYVFVFAAIFDPIDFFLSCLFNKFSRNFES